MILQNLGHVGFFYWFHLLRRYHLFKQVGTIGLLRMPDLYLRTSVSSKGSTLGIASIMLATAFTFGELGASSRAIAVIVFMMLTAPVAAHMLGRAAYRAGVMPWSKTCTEPK